MKILKIFIDGSCIKNPGNGGCGIIIKKKSYIMEYKIGFYNTTNNRMELKSSIIALNLVKKFSFINIYTDSLYLKNGITIWIKLWKKNKWKNKNNKKIKNLDLWIKLYNLSKLYYINWIWIKKNSLKENIKCDLLAKKAAKNPFYIDNNY